MVVDDPGHAAGDRRLGVKGSGFKYCPNGMMRRLYRCRVRTSAERRLLDCFRELAYTRFSS